MNNQIIVSTPPHVKSARTTKGIMLDVLIALVPCAIAGIVFFGLNALLIEVVAILGAVATEFVYFFIAKGGFKDKCKNAWLTCKKWWRQFDYTSAVSGLILALILPVTVKWYEVLLGSVFAIALVKMLFGGTGKNLVNPAAAGRVFMFLSFAISSYTACNIGAIFAGDDSLITGATVLSGNLLQGNEAGMSLIDLLLGTGLAGCIGETCKLAIIVGYIYLCVRKVIKWWQPLLVIATCGVIGTLLTATNGAIDFSFFLPSILSGGLMFGAVFMATDYVTSPKSTAGQIVYYVALGLLTAVLRHVTKIEVMSFIIMLMNLIVPLIDTYIIRKPFGYVNQTKKEGK